MEHFSVSKIIYEVYVPFMIAIVSIAVPMIGILLSVFSQGRHLVIKFYESEIKRITDDIKANETTKKHWMITLFFQLIQKRYKLMVLTPKYYLPLLSVPPILSIIFAIICVYYYQLIFLIISIVFFLVFILILCSMINLIAKITETRDAEKEERDRSTLETLQGILKNSEPDNDLVKNCEITIASKVVNDGEFLPSVVLGREAAYRMSFQNGEGTLYAKKVEVGIQLPKEFEIKKQSGYDVYEPDNIVRYNQEYVACKTDWYFEQPLIFTPKITGEYKIVVWMKGENIKAKYRNLNIKVETAV